MEEKRLERALREASSALIHRLEELSFLRVVGDSLVGENEPDAVARRLVGLLCDELGLEFAGFWTVDDAAGGLRLAACAPPATALRHAVSLARAPLSAASSPRSRGLPTATLRCSCSARAAPARRWWRARCITAAVAAGRRSWPSTAQRCRRRCSRASSSESS